MPTSRQHIEACLTKIRSAGMSPAKAASTPEGFQLHVAVWLERLARYDPRAVSAAFERWIDSHDEWPLPKGLLPLVEAEQAKIEGASRIAGPDPLKELSQSVNVAFGYLSNAHLREIDRLEPRRRQQLVNTTADWFLPHWRQAIMDMSKGQAAMRPWIAMINEFIEGKLGKSWRQILDEERIARDTPLTPVTGFKTLDEALGGQRPPEPAHEPPKSPQPDRDPHRGRPRGRGREPPGGPAARGHGGHRQPRPTQDPAPPGRDRRHRQPAVTGPRTRPGTPPPPLRVAAATAVTALLDVPLPPKARRAVQALKDALEGSP